jgi:zinc transporter, ZIP family
MKTFAEWHPLLQALLAGCFTWAVTAFGAAFVFFTSSLNRRLLDGMAGFASGVMIAASYWSLLAPAIELSSQQGRVSWAAPAIGFLAGGVFLWLFDKLLPHLHRGLPAEAAEGVKTKWKRSTLLVLAITLHNIPEGLAVGVAFGAAAAGSSSATVTAAVVLAIGIGIQNFPEGLAISLPLRREGMSRWKAFSRGQASAIVEPIAAIVGAGATFFATPLLPYALSFAAGAMIFVVVEELIPESHRGENADLSTMSAMIGFTLMMVLDVAFG